jgi:hypothetical protein
MYSYKCIMNEDYTKYNLTQFKLREKKQITEKKVNKSIKTYIKNNVWSKVIKLS